MARDLTKGSPVPLILAFAVPLFIGNFLQQSYSLADAFIVGRLIGKEALAAVGCTTSLNFLFIWFVGGVSFGTSLVVSRRFGAGDMEGVRKSFAVNIVVCMGVAAVLALLSVAFARPLLVFLNTPDEILNDAYIYIAIIFASLPLLMFYNMLSNCLRAVGDSRTPLYFLIISCVLNVALNLVFVAVFNLGVKGVALGTIIAQLISGLLCFFYINRKVPALKLSAQDWKFAYKEVIDHLMLGLPVGFQGSLVAIGFVAVSFFINKLGVSAVAAFTAGARIIAPFDVIVLCLGTAMATFTAQNFGAKEYSRIRKGIFRITLIAFAYSIGVALVFLFFGRPLAGLLLTDGTSSTIDMANTYLVITSSFYIFLSLLIIFRASLQGMGNSLAPTIAGIMELVMRVFAAIVFSQVFSNNSLAYFTGLCFANPLAWVGSFIPLAIAFAVIMKKAHR